MSITQHEIRDERVLLQAPESFAQWDKGQTATGLRRGCPLGVASGKGQRPGDRQLWGMAECSRRARGCHTEPTLNVFVAGEGPCLEGTTETQTSPCLKPRSIVQRGHCTSRPHRRSQVPKVLTLNLRRKERNFSSDFQGPLSTKD